MDTTEVKEVAVETPVAAPDVSAQPAQGGQPTTPTPAGDGGLPNYTPNYKFNVMDKEHEFDEWVRPVIKNQEMEKKVKELYEKAYGLDHVKPKYEATQKERDEFRKNYESLHNDVAEAMQYKNIGDLDTFFKKVSLSVDDVANWLVDKVERQKLPDGQRKVYDELDTKRRSELETSRRMQDLETRYQQMATQAREAEVNSVLARADVNPIVERYDSLNGKGAFKQFVAETGFAHYNLHGEDPSAEMAVSAVLKRLGEAYKTQPGQVSQPTAMEKPLPVIPNVSGKNVSPAQKQPKSIEDLRKIAAEMRA